MAEIYTLNVYNYKNIVSSEYKNIIESEYTNMHGNLLESVELKMDMKLKNYH